METKTLEIPQSNPLLDTPIPPSFKSSTQQLDSSTPLLDSSTPQIPLSSQLLESPIPKSFESSTLKMLQSLDSSTPLLDSSIQQLDSSTPQIPQSLESSTENLNSMKSKEKKEQLQELTEKYDSLIKEFNKIQTYNYEKKNMSYEEILEIFTNLKKLQTFSEFATEYIPKLLENNQV